MKTFTTMLKNKNRRTELIIGVPFLLLIWHLIAMGVGNINIFPTPLAVIGSLANIVTSPNFFTVVTMTLSRVLVGLTLSFCLALILGLISVNSRFVKSMLNPLVSVMKAIPTIAITVQLIIWLGPFQAPPAVGFIVIFPLLYSAVVEGLENIDLDIIEMANVYNVPKVHRIKHIYYPSVVSYLSAALAGSIGLCIKVIISAEYISTTRNSMGDGIYYGFAYFDMAEVWSWAVVAIITSAVLELPLRQLKKRICQWREVD